MDKGFNLLVNIIYLLFAFDSLFKIPLFGIQIHIGVILILIVNFSTIITRPRFDFNFFKHHFFYILFGLYLFLNGLFLNGVSSLLMYFYFFLASNVLFFIYRNSSCISNNTLRYFQYILILTGLFQFFTFHLFGYQISFIDAEHYNKGYSVAERLRGFFVEPNWFSIAITFNTLLLIKNDLIVFFRKYLFLAILTFIVFVLNGSFGLAFILFLFYFRRYLFKNFIVTIGMILVVISGLFYVTNQRSSFKESSSKVELLNTATRIIPLYRTFEYLSDERITKFFFGEGFGTWGEVAIQNNISLLTKKPDSTKRGASEFPVLFFELGFFGILLFLLDIIYLFRISKSKDSYLRAALVLFLLSLFLYPIFKFSMYMVYYFLVRALIIKEDRVLKLSQ